MFLLNVCGLSPDYTVFRIREDGTLHIHRCENLKQSQQRRSIFLQLHLCNILRTETATRRILSEWNMKPQEKNFNIVVRDVVNR
jgi:hypothetical protein